MTDSKILVIFICTGNTCRSPMAEALFKKRIKDEGNDSITVLSRGIATYGGDCAAHNAIEVMSEYGCDISLHRSCALTQNELINSNLLVCMTEEHSNVLRRYGAKNENVAIMNIPDPYGGDLETYRTCAEKINEELDKIYALTKKL